MTAATARDTFRDLMQTAQRRKLTESERVRLSKARQMLRRAKRPAMNRTRRNPKRSAAKTHVHYFVQARDYGDPNRMLYWAGWGWTGKRAGAKRYATEHEAREVADWAAPKGSGNAAEVVRVVPPGKRLAGINPRRKLARGRKAARKNPGRVRMGKLIELRYDRDHGSKPGFYKHVFRTKPTIYYYPDSDKIVIQGGR